MRDGTINKLIQIFRSNNNDFNQDILIQIFAYMFKANPLPTEIEA